MPICAICGKPMVGKQMTTIRELWIKLGGYGAIPPEAIVHVKCDDREQGHEHRSRI